MGLSWEMEPRASCRAQLRGKKPPQPQNLRMKIFTFPSCAFKAGLEIIIIIKKEAFSFGEAVPWFLLLLLLFFMGLFQSSTGEVGAKNAPFRIRCFGRIGVEMQLYEEDLDRCYTSPPPTAALTSADKALIPGFWQTSGSLDVLLQEAQSCSSGVR